MQNFRGKNPQLIKLAHCLPLCSLDKSFFLLHLLLLLLFSFLFFSILFTICSEWSCLCPTLIWAKGSLRTTINTFTNACSHLNKLFAGKCRLKTGKDWNEMEKHRSLSSKFLCPSLRSHEDEAQPRLMLFALECGCSRFHSLRCWLMAVDSSLFQP